jgi:alkylation response protein AidB-like acyl-CoA dehydrogenase
MQFGLTETQETLKKSVREFLNAECPIAVVRKLIETETAFDAGLWSKIAAQGWTGLLIPEEFGGYGMGMVEMAVVLEEMGRALLPGPFLSTALVASTVIERGGTVEQKRKYLPAIASGQLKATLAATEHRSKELCFEFVPDAGIADLIVCAGPLNGEFSLFIAPAIEATHTPALDLTRPLYEVALDGGTIPSENILARGRQARDVLDAAIDIATAGLTAEMTGGMQRLLEIAVAYAKTRKQFGRPIGQFQAVQHLCADMLLMTESSRSAAYYACYAVNVGLAEAAAEAVSIAKSYASDAYREVGNRAIQVHGGMGFTWENDCHLYYRRAKASELAYGDAIHHRERLARIIIGRPAAVVAGQVS